MTSTAFSPAPRHANAGQRETFRALMADRTSIYALVVGGSVALVYGAWRGSPALIVGGPLIVAALVASVCAFVADRMSAQRFFAAFAASRGLDYSARWELLELTPLLGAGDRRWCEHWMPGEIVREPSLTGGMGHFVYEERGSTRVGGIPRQEFTQEHHRFTLAAVDLEASIRHFHGIFVHPRRGLLGYFSDWLDHPPSTETEVESAAFTQRFQLRLADEQDPLRARQLLSPTLVDWLATHPLELGLELRGGTLVVFTKRVLEDTGNLTLFHEGVRELTSRVVDEVGEAAATSQASRPQSVPPPAKA